MAGQCAVPGNDELHREPRTVAAEHSLHIESALFVLAILMVLLTRALWRRDLLAAAGVAVVTPYAAVHLEFPYVVAATFAYLIVAPLGIELLWSRLRRGSALVEPAGRDGQLGAPVSS